MVLSILKGDITEMKVDAIVNAANSSLLGGGGVDGAIHRKGGRQILEECILIRNRQGGCKTGEAVYTNAGKLDARYVIHTVDPVWNNGQNEEKKLLKKCYTNTLSLAQDLGVKSIAFPNVSTGIYKFPKTVAAKIAIEVIQAFAHSENTIQEIIMVCFDQENFDIYKELLSRQFLAVEEDGSRFSFTI